MTSRPETEIIIGSDHAGYKLREHIKDLLEQKNFSVEDVSRPEIDNNDDYPVFAARVARAVSAGRYSRGIVICGAGIGASIAANRFRNVRAALCCTPQMAELSRRHNNANVLALGGRVTSPKVAGQILDTWLETPFDGGRHKRRVRLLDTVIEEEL